MPPTCVAGGRFGGVAILWRHYPAELTAATVLRGVAISPTVQVHVEEFTIEYQRKSYTGHRSVTGTQMLYQTIYYRGHSRADGHPYRPSEETAMKLVANSILRELVEEQLREAPE